MGWSNSNTSSGGGGGGSVDSVTGLNTNNTDPANPIVALSVDSTLTGAGTPASPLGVNSSSLVTINPTTNYIPVKTGTNTFGNSPLSYDTINALLKTIYSAQTKGLLIDYINILYYLMDNSSKISLDWNGRLLNDSNEVNSINYQTRILLDNSPASSLDWDGRTLYATLGMFSALSYGCSREKTESLYYQNDFLARLGSQGRIIDNAVNLSQFWWSGHTIEATNTPPILTPIGSVLVLKAGSWIEADFSGADGTLMVGIWLGGGQILLDGHLVVTTLGTTVGFPEVDGLSTSTEIGMPIYGDPALLGNMTITQPTTLGNTIRRLGHAYYEDGINTGYYLMLFRPSNDWRVV